MRWRLCLGAAGAACGLLAAAGCAGKNDGHADPRGEPMELGTYRPAEQKNPVGEPLVVFAADEEPSAWDKFWRVITFQKDPQQAAGASAQKSRDR